MKIIFAVLAVVAVVGSAFPVRADSSSGWSKSIPTDGIAKDMNDAKSIDQGAAGNSGSSRRTFIYPDEFSLINNKPVTVMHFFALLGNAFTDENEIEAQECADDNSALQKAFDLVAPGFVSVDVESIQKSVGPSSTPTIDPANADSTPGPITLTAHRDGRVLKNGEIDGQTTGGSYQKASEATLCAHYLVASAGHQIVFKEVRVGIDQCPTAQDDGSKIVTREYKSSTGVCEMLTVK